jgi:hypothetical protein
VVGWGTSEAGEEAVYWIDGGGGLQRLADVLTDQGLDLDGWTLVRATGVSESGRTIVGWGTNPGGQTEGFVARLAAAPVPVPALRGWGLALAGALLSSAGLLPLRLRAGVGERGRSAAQRWKSTKIGDDQARSCAGARQSSSKSVR